jgi:hypothetical protein
MALQPHNLIAKVVESFQVVKRGQLATRVRSVAARASDIGEEFAIERPGCGKNNAQQNADATDCPECHLAIPDQSLIDSGDSGGCVIRQNDFMEQIGSKDPAFTQVSSIARPGCLTCIVWLKNMRGIAIERPYSLHGEALSGRTNLG